MSFDRCIEPKNHCHNEHIKYFHIPNISSYPFCIFQKRCWKRIPGQLAHFLISRQLALFFTAGPMQFLPCQVPIKQNFPQLLTRAALAGNPDTIALIALLYLMLVDLNLNINIHIRLVVTILYNAGSDFTKSLFQNSCMLESHGYVCARYTNEFHGL